MTVFYATIGAKALYMLFIWLLSSAGAAWMAERKGYGERVGLTFGLVLTFVGFIIVLLLPGRPGSTWKVEGPLPRRAKAPLPASRAPVGGTGASAGGTGASAGASGAEGPGASGPKGSGASGEPPPGDGPPTQPA